MGHDDSEEGTSPVTQLGDLRAEQPPSSADAANACKRSTRSISMDYLHEPEFLGVLPKIEEEIEDQLPQSFDLTRLLAEAFDEAEGVFDDEASDLPHVGRFRLLRQLGSGTFGVVYLAVDNYLHRDVALKVPRIDAFDDPEVRARFVREGRAAAMLSHPNIVPILDADDRDGRIYIAAQFVPGPTLAEWLDKQKLPVNPKMAAALIADLADAVQHAHENGILHRDIKPSNILLQPRKQTLEKDEGEPGLLSSYTPKLCDFGLAKELQAESDLTATGQILGTPNYMSPEQAAGASSVGPAADIYALGAVLYVVLTGQPPFQAASTLQTIRQVIGQEPESLARSNPSIDRDIETVCLKCLQKAPKHRFEDARHLAEELRRYLRGEPILARPISGLERTWRWCRRRPAIAASILAASATLLTLFALALVGSQLNASRERAKRLEKDAELRQTQLKAANELAESHRNAAMTEHYYALVSRVRERAGNPEMGWAYAGLSDLRTAASLDVEAVDRLDLRNEAARCVTGVDLCEIASVPVPPGYEPHLIAFRPDGKQLAIATLGSDTELCVLVCDVPSGSVVDDLRIPVIGPIVFDGIRHLAYLGGGDELAITTRSGWLHRWQPGESPPALQSRRMPRPEMKPFVFDGARRRAFFGSEGKLYAWPDLSTTVTEEFDTTNVQHLMASPDGRWLAASHRGVTVFDTQNRRRVQHIDEFPALVCFSPNGRIISGIWASELVLADVESARTFRTFRDPDTGQLHEDAVTESTFSPSGGLLLTSGHDQRFKLWDTNSGKLLSSILIAGADEVRAAFSPDERYVAATGGDRVILYSLNGTDVLGTAAGQIEPIRAFDVSRDPPVVFCSAASPDGYVRLSIWDFERGTMIDHWQHPGGRGAGTSVAISDDARALAAAQSDSRYIRTWQLGLDSFFDQPDSPRHAEEYVGYQHPVTRQPIDEAFHGLSADNPVHAATNLGLRTSLDYRLEVSADEVRAEKTAALVLSRDGSMLFGAVNGVEAVAWSLPEISEQWRWSNAQAAEQVGMGAVSSIDVGERLVVVGAKSKSMLLFDTKSGERLLNVPTPGRVSAVTLNDDESLAACGTYDGVVVIASIPDGNIIARHDEHRDEVTSLAFSDGSQLLATSSRDKTVRLWHRKSEAFEQVLTLKLGSSIQQVRFAKSGTQLIASVKGESVLRVWHLDRLRERLAGLGLNW